MNKLKTDLDGGFPYVLDDLRWADASYREAFYGIMSAFGATDEYTFILSGCVRSVSVGVVTITEGYVSIGGEVCHVPEHSYAEPTGSDVEYWEVGVSYDVAGQKTFQNSVVNDTYEVRIAQIVIGDPVPVGSTSYGDTQTLFEIIEASFYKSNSYNLDDSNTYATSKAVRDLYVYLVNNLNAKQNKATAVKFATHFVASSPIWTDYNLGDIVYVGASAPYDLYIHNGSGWTIINA